MNIEEIISGWRNHIIPPKELKEFISKVSEERLSICKACEFNSTPDKIKFYSRCKVCKCPLIQKSKSLKSKCPVDKWGPVANEDQEYEINLAINGQKDSSQHRDMEADSNS